MNLSRWSLTGGIEFTFPDNFTLPGGSHVVIAAIPGQIRGAIGPFTGNLNNNGEVIRLRNQNGRIMDEVEYSDRGDWPTGPDGTGVTLARRPHDRVVELSYRIAGEEVGHVRCDGLVAAVELDCDDDGSLPEDDDVGGADDEEEDEDEFGELEGPQAHINTAMFFAASLRALYASPLRGAAEAALKEPALAQQLEGVLRHVAGLEAQGTPAAEICPPPME
jgi:hypothetical protein